jgi:hypothetical protein
MSSCGNSRDDALTKVKAPALRTLADPLSSRSKGGLKIKFLDERPEG